MTKLLMRSASCLLLGLALTGCAQRIKYSLKDVTAAGQPVAQDLYVKVFSDETDPEAPRTGWIKNGPGTVWMDGKQLYYNSQYNYKQDVIAPWLTNMLVKHLEARKIFRSVKWAEESNPPEGFLLEGKIKKFYAWRERSSGTETGQMFGAIGMLMTMGIDSPWGSETILEDVTLTNLASGKVLFKKRFSSSLTGEDYADPQGWSVYERANRSLKIAGSELVKEIETAVR